MGHLSVLLIVGAILVALFVSSPHHGFTSHCLNDQCYVAASTSPIGLVASAALAVFLFFYPQLRPDVVVVEPVKLWKRGVALYIDFLVLLSITSPIATIPVLLAEARANGSFAWNFSRDFTRPADAMLALPSIFAIFIALFLYFYIHLRLQRQTIGQYLMGFRIEAEPGKTPDFLLNVALSWVGMCMWPFALYGAAKHPEKLFWWNVLSRTRVIPAL